ncbi:MAG: 2Fe-2S iron-sulfur cluster-binding protein [Cyanobacteria bacterium J06559_1]
MLKTRVINSATNKIYEACLEPKSLRRSECLIGRHPDCDLVLDGPEVSRVHGRVLFEDEGCFFSDLGSTDGSRLNNQVMEVNRCYAIAPDDVLRIGDFALIVEDLRPTDTSQSAPESSSWPQGALSVRCIQINRETPDVKTFRFVAEPAVLFNFRPGQFVTVKLPVADAKGNPVIRSYSISSSPSRPHTLDITVKRVGSAGENYPPGIASNWLHDHFKVGMPLTVQGPYGDFCYVNEKASDRPQKLLLISAGSGITPMMSIAQWVSDLAEKTEITFIHVAKSPGDIIFRQRLALLATQHPHFKLAFSLTQPSMSVPWAGYRGRLNEALLTAIAPDFAEHTAYVCGPAGFMGSTRQLLNDTGFPMERYFEERFSSPAAIALEKSASPATVTVPETDKTSDPMVEFSVSGKQIKCDDEQTLLDTAEQAGISMTSGCRMGSCGVCKHQLVSGAVTHAVEPRCLSESDLAEGYVLPCIAKPIDTVVLAL